MTKYLTTGRIFAAMFAIVLGCFLWTGAESVMTRLGFETKTSLAKKLQTETHNKDLAIQANEGNLATIKDLKASHAKELKALQALHDKKQESEKTAAKILSEQKRQSSKARTAVVDKKKVTDTEITLPIAEINKMSQANITAVHSAFDQFFPKES